MERNLVANALLPNSQEFLVSYAGLTPFWGRTKGTHLLNWYVYLFSFWFCITELWQNPKETSAGRKITLFSALANSTFLPDFAKQSCLALQASPAATIPFWPSNCIFPDQSDFFSYSIFFPKPFLFLLALHLFPFLPISLTFYYFSILISPLSFNYCYVLKSFLDFWVLIFLKSNENSGSHDCLA